MIEYFPPALTEKLKLKPSDLKHHSASALDPLGFDPSLRITSNFDAVDASQLKLGNTRRGRLFELCFYDALVHYGVDPHRIKLHIDYSGGFLADIDLLVEDTGLLLKTSLRERWKQLDRDCLVIRDLRRLRKEPELDLWCVFYRERPGDSVDQMTFSAVRHQRMMYSGAKLRTVLDQESMVQVFKACGADG